MNNNSIFHSVDIKKYSFLVTGGAGFIGSNIVRYLLEHGAGKVRVLDNLLTGSIDNLKPFMDHSAFEFINGDICDSEVCRKSCNEIDFVTHQAALGSVPRSIKDPATTHAINASGFLNMISAAKDAKVKRFVYASSSSVYGDSPTLPKKENETGAPLSPYAVSKKTNELYAGVFALNYGLEVIGLRYFNVFGPNQSPEGVYAAVVPLFMHHVLQGTSPYIDGDGEQTRDFTYVENAVQANIRSFFSTHPNAINQVYNVAVGENASVNQLFKTIAELEGSLIKPVYRETRQGDIRNSLADITKSKNLLEYQPTVQLKEGLQRTMNWFKASLMKNN